MRVECNGCANYEAKLRTVSSVNKNHLKNSPQFFEASFGFLMNRNSNR